MTVSSHTDQGGGYLAELPDKLLNSLNVGTIVSSTLHSIQHIHQLQPKYVLIHELKQSAGNALYLS